MRNEVCDEGVARPTSVKDEAHTRTCSRHLCTPKCTLRIQAKVKPKPRRGSLGLNCVSNSLCSVTSDCRTWRWMNTPEYPQQESLWENALTTQIKDRAARVLVCYKDGNLRDSSIMVFKLLMRGQPRKLQITQAPEENNSKSSHAKGTQNCGTHSEWALGFLADPACT